MKISNNKKGFTLIELLIIIVIIAILASTVIVALNPIKRFKDARDSRRYSDVNSIQTAIQQYIVDNDGSLPTGMTSGTMAETQLGTCTSGGATLCTSAAAACLNLSTPLTSYLKSIPKDPSGGSNSTTGYSVSVANSIITVKACSPENASSIEVAR